MKAQRRHELQTNELAHWMAQTADGASPHLSKIVFGALGVVALVGLVLFLASRTSGKTADQWEQYFAAYDQDTPDSRITELNSVADQLAGSLPGAWARLAAADASLARGTERSFKDRLAGETDLQQAYDNYQSVLKDADKFPAAKSEFLRVRAMWGLAETLEAQAKGEEALQQYKKLAEVFPDSALGKAAAERAQYIGTMGDWFQWYAGVDPTKIKPTRTQPTGPGLFNDSDLPDVSLPQPLEGGSSTGGLFDDALNPSGGLTLPLPDTTPPATDPPPETEPPATEPPADKPAEPAPPSADDKPDADAAPADAPADAPAEGAAPADPAPSDSAPAESGDAPAEPAPPAEN